MFQDEKTTELDLNKPLPQSRWTENHPFPAGTQFKSSAVAAPKAPAAIEPTHLPWLFKFAAAVTILILSLWLF